MPSKRIAKIIKLDKKLRRNREGYYLRARVEREQFARVILPRDSLKKFGIADA